jgi:hypothetical protein
MSLKILKDYGLDLGPVRDEGYPSSSPLKLACQIQSFQKPGEPVIAPERVKKWLYCQQVDEICLVIDRFIEALQCQIEIFQSDRSQSFCQGTTGLCCVAASRQRCQSPNPMGARSLFS